MGNRVEARSPAPWTAAEAPHVEALLVALDAGDARAVEALRAAHPELADVIGRRLQLIDWLESARTGASASDAAGPCDLSTALAGLAAQEQRLVYLRLVERAPWAEVARQLGGSEEALRREHAAVVRRLIERCHEWLASPGAPPEMPALLRGGRRPGLAPPGRAIVSAWNVSLTPRGRRERRITTVCRRLHASTLPRSAR